MLVRLLILLLTELLQERSLVRSLTELLLEWLPERVLLRGKHAPQAISLMKCLLMRQSDRSQ